MPPDISAISWEAFQLLWNTLAPLSHKNTKTGQKDFYSNQHFLLPSFLFLFRSFFFDLELEIFFNFQFKTALFETIPIGRKTAQLRLARLSLALDCKPYLSHFPCQWAELLNVNKYRCLPRIILELHRSMSTSTEVF